MTWRTHWGTTSASWQAGRCRDLHRLYGKLFPFLVMCVYYGDQNVQRWDQLVPVNKAGETVLGNMLPACARCNDSHLDLHC